VRFSVRRFSGTVSGGVNGVSISTTTKADSTSNQYQDTIADSIIDSITALNQPGSTDSTGSNTGSTGAQAAQAAQAGQATPPPTRRLQLPPL
jgi:hypothetical protein